MNDQFLTLEEMAEIIGTTRQKADYAVKNYGPEPDISTPRVRLWKKSAVAELRRVLGQIKTYKTKTANL